MTLINNQSRRLRAFKHLHLTTSLAVLLYSHLALRFIMAQPKRSRTVWDTPQELRMIELLMSLKSTADNGSANFKKSQLTQVADTLNKEFTQVGAPKSHANVQTRWNRVSTLLVIEKGAYSCNPASS